MSLILQILTCLLLLSSISCDSPSVNLTLLQNILPTGYGAGNVNYYKQSNICVKDDYLGIPSDNGQNLFLYKFNQGTQQYALLQTLNSSFHSEFSNGNPRSCAFASTYDLYVGFETMSEVGVVYLYIFSGTNWVAGGSSTVSPPANAGTQSIMYGYRIYDAGNDYFVITAPGLKSGTLTGSLQVVQYQGFTQLINPELDIGYGYTYSLAFGANLLLALFGGTSVPRSQYNAYYLLNGTTSTQASPPYNILPYGTKPSDPSTPITFGGIAFLNVTTVAVRSIYCTKNTSVEGGTSTPNYVGQIDILSYNANQQTWNNISYLYEDLPRSYFNPSAFSGQYYNYGDRLSSYQSLLFYTTGANELKVSQRDGTSVKLLATYYNPTAPNFSCRDDPTSNTATNCVFYPVLYQKNRLYLNHANGLYVFNLSLSCNNGYRLNTNLICNDIDECAEGTAQCSPLRTCVNTPGGYTCANCPSGYRNNGTYNCSEIDECAEGTALCRNRTCINTAGSYSCASDCPPGYTTNGNYTCIDLDECSGSSTNNCSKSPVRQCQNTPGGYTCADCPNGYSNSGPYNCVANSNTQQSGSNNVGSTNNPTGGSSVNPQSTSGNPQSSTPAQSSQLPQPSGKKGSGLILVATVLYLIVVLF